MGAFQESEGKLREGVVSKSFQFLVWSLLNNKWISSPTQGFKSQQHILVYW